MKHRVITKWEELEGMRITKVSAGCGELVMRMMCDGLEYVAKIDICDDYGGECSLTMSDAIYDSDLLDLGIITTVEFERRSAEKKKRTEEANEASDRATYERLKRRFDAGYMK